MGRKDNPKRKIEIIVGDSAKILKSIQSGSIDLVLTDPPYDFPKDLQNQYQSEFKRICKGAIIVFCPPENQWSDNPDQYLFWEKPISTKNTTRRYSRFIEMILIWNGKTWNADRHWSQYTNVFKDLVDETSLHPFRKPPSMIRRLLLNHSNPGNLILDPFAGSGVVGEVCEAVGRRYTLIDKVIQKER